MIFQCPENGCNKILDTDEESYLEHHLSSHCRKGDCGCGYQFMTTQENIFQEKDWCL